MSGICAVVSLDGAPIDPRAVDEMVAAAPHRSRDRSRTWHGPTGAIAHQATHASERDAADRQPLTHAGLVLVAAGVLVTRRRAL